MANRPILNKGRHPQAIPLPIFLFLIAALLAPLYAITRYGGLWGETDTATFTQAIRAVYDSASLLPDSGYYPNGYGYPVLGVFIIHASGIGIPDLQLSASALLFAWLVLPAWLAYREMTGSGRVANLAVVLLLVQPEVLFVALRGTHEKFTRGLMFLCLYLFARSLRTRDDKSRFACFVIAFYLSAYALIAFNNLLASAFILSILLAAGLIHLAQVAQRRTQKDGARAVPRLISAGVTLILLAFIYTFFIYPPAQQHLRLMQTVVDRLAALFLQVEARAYNPYTAVNAGWINLPVYLSVSLANWMLLALSLYVWLDKTIKHFFLRRRLGENELLLWGFFAACALITAASVAVDVSGAISGNLQHRLFPSFAMFASPLAAGWLACGRWRGLRAGRLTQVGFGVGIGLLSVLSLFKATNEPLLSNKWTFFLPGEMQALRWADSHLPGRSLWTDFDERLAAAAAIQYDLQSWEVRLDHYQAEPLTRHLLVSEVTRLRSQRLGSPIPLEPDSLLIYDNGPAQIYHLRPRTPYQR